MPQDYTIACYYFPNYHVDPRNEAAHGPDWTEWELVKRAEPRFPGHRQPRVPAWGYEDESDPTVMARKIAAAADHGIDVFLFDWYHYDDGPFLERGLDKGFLGASEQRPHEVRAHVGQPQLGGHPPGQAERPPSATHRCSTPAQ